MWEVTPSAAACVAHGCDIWWSGVNTPLSNCVTTVLSHCHTSHVTLLITSHRAPPRPRARIRRRASCSVIWFKWDPGSWRQWMPPLSLSSSSASCHGGSRGLEAIIGLGLVSPQPGRVTARYTHTNNTLVTCHESHARGLYCCIDSDTWLLSVIELSYFIDI